jgi:transposase
LGLFSIYGLSPLVALEGNQNQHTYNELSKEYLVTKIRAAKDYFDVNMIFMHDNALCHKTKLVSDFLARIRNSVLDWPPLSPDINPIENLWAIIKQKRQKNWGPRHENGAD